MADLTAYAQVDTGPFNFGSKMAPTVTTLYALAQYVREAWPLIEPGNAYKHNWHVDLLCEYLEAVTRGELRNVIINVPPGTMKSLLVSVCWPTWTWTHQPEMRWMFGSYSSTFAMRDAVKSRRILRSDWYQGLWGHQFQLTGDQNVKSRYENSKGGFRLSVGVGGSSLGEHPHIRVIDDPVKPDEAESETTRESVNEWYDNNWYTRGDRNTVREVIIMQRLHQDDLTGHVLEKAKETHGLYEHVCLPMEYEPHRFVSTIGLKDMRTEPNELLWPERFPEKAVADLKVFLGARGAAGQLQQRPAPAGGNIFMREWWDGQRNRYRGTSAFWNLTVGRWITFDTAMKDKKDNDPTGYGVVELTADYRLAVRKSVLKRLQFPQLASEIQDAAKLWNSDGKLQGIVIEDKNSGTSAIQTLRQSAPSWLAALIIDFMPSGSKEFRARQASLWCERDCVLFPADIGECPWWFDFEKEIFDFPGAAHDEQVDWLSQIVLYLEHYLAEGWRLRNGL